MKMQPTPDVTEGLARHIAATRWEDVPPEVRHQAKRSLVNFFAVTLAGCRSRPIETTLRSLSEFSGGRQVALIGRPEKIDALSAAFLNAAGANVDDFCDTHTATVIHPTAPVAGALFAYAGLRVVAGRDLLLAFVLGNEVQDRIGLAISPSHYNRGWHITSTCGVFGAASAIGKLAPLDQRQMVWALGNAATQSAGLCECLGTPAKSLSVGNAARNGLWSALLAGQGYDGPAEPLAGRQGFYHALAEAPDLSQITEGWGERWEIMATSYKPYPCGFVIHPVLDCVLDWRRDHPGVDVARVVVRGNPLLSVRADRPNVSTGREAQVSVQHAVAAALLKGQAGLDQFTDACVNDPEVLKLRGKVEILRDESFSTIAAAVDITTSDGQVFRLEQKAARGSDANPLSDRDLEDKLRAAASLWNPRYETAPLIDAIWNVEASTDVSKLVSLTVPR
ncbi:MAG TPA: MmgE/PrpD family protein [Bradyrhizobium sp.]|uniref:MmgE/PrpD family protein n=1 Tax=Bradyrhizobium sp. TaxID=376 RepID=UPI002D7F2E71|nr:MmgE/PrpD family protein [Bradyrhizobium sp.]HET7885016.1 MmgE/PrpD family protein [Bradyrhizobium sp.]